MDEPRRTPMEEARRKILVARRIVRGCIKRKSYTESEVRLARKTLFEAIDALDSYILVPPGEYRKVRR